MDKSVIPTCRTWPSSLGEANSAPVIDRQLGIMQANAVMTEGGRQEGAKFSVLTTTFRRMLVFCALCLLVSGYGSGCLLAQDPQSDPYHFSSVAQPVLDRLDSLQMLAAKEWRYHLGDIPHGERPDLDDSSWAQVTPETDLSQDAVWLRRWIEIPTSWNGYDITGTHIWFNMNVGANELFSEIIYVNGARIAMGTQLEDVLLFNDARPGQRILVAVKYLATKNIKRYRGALLRIEPVAGRPNPVDLLSELQAAAHLLPVVEPSPARLSGLEQQLDSAAAAVDLNALSTGNQAAFDASLRLAEAHLEFLRPILRRYSIHASGNAHIDAAWMWPWTETVDVVHHTFETALQLMNEYPGYTFSQSAAAYSEWMEQKYPAVFEGTQQRVRDGRWELTGGMWVEPDLNLPDGESQVRQLLVGKRYFKEKFGIDVRVGWNPDSFGFNWQLPQIYKKSGIDFFVTHKIHWNETNQLPLKLFWWQAPDGSRVLTYFPHGYGRHLEPVEMASDLADAVSLNPGATSLLHLYGVGDHGGGPTRDMLDSGMRWMQDDAIFPKMEFGSALDFFETTAARLDVSHVPVWNYQSLAKGNLKLPEPPPGKISLPVWNDELYLEYHRGVYTTQAEHKANMRHSEVWLLNAEKFASLGWLSGQDYSSSALNEAWKKVLFNQFHDLAAGSGIAVIYRDAERDYDQVHSVTENITAEALASVASHIDTRVVAGVPLLVWNPMAWERSDLVEATLQMPETTPKGVSVLDPKGNVLPIQILSHDELTRTYRLLIRVENVPALGYMLLRAVPGARPFASSLRTAGTTIENEFLRVTVDPQTGCITSIFEKKSLFDSLVPGSCGNMLQTFHDLPEEYDAWNIDPGTLDNPIQLIHTDSVRLVESGALRSIVRVTSHTSESKFVQDITLYAGIPRVDVVNDFEWHETHVLLKAAFSLAASSRTATYEIPFGTIDRPTTRENPVDSAKFEVPAIRWADLGDGQHGFAILNESKYGYDAKGNVLRLTLLRSPLDPDPNADRGRQHFSYSLYPHSGSWQDALVVRRGFDFNYALSASQVQAHTGELPREYSFISVAPENLVLTAMKKSEDGGDLVLRFYEWAGKNTTARISVPPGVSDAVETNLMEQADSAHLQIVGNQVMVPVGPYSINTVRLVYPKRGSGFWKDQR
jgi:alpha-mannosidase